VKDLISYVIRERYTDHFGVAATL